MEKLSKLLNEYLESKKKDIQQFINIAALMTQSDSKLYQTYIISKDFEFIKWLVENDKIDKKKIQSPIMHYKVEEDREGWIHYYDLDFANKINSLLMLLSISDTPIEDLISYLK